MLDIPGGQVPGLSVPLLDTAAAEHLAYAPAHGLREQAGLILYDLLLAGQTVLHRCVDTNHSLRKLLLAPEAHMHHCQRCKREAACR